MLDIKKADEVEQKLTEVLFESDANTDSILVGVSIFLAKTIASAATTRVSIDTILDPFFDVVRGESKKLFDHLEKGAKEPH